MRVRGNTYQVMEKYLALARDASLAGDRVAMENYLQHAEHYYRTINANGDANRPRPQQMRSDGQVDGSQGGNHQGGSGQPGGSQAGGQPANNQSGGGPTGNGFDGQSQGNPHTPQESHPQGHQHQPQGQVRATPIAEPTEDPEN